MAAPLREEPLEGRVVLLKRKARRAARRASYLASAAAVLPQSRASAVAVAVADGHAVRVGTAHRSRGWRARPSAVTRPATAATRLKRFQLIQGGALARKSRPVLAVEDRLAQAHRYLDSRGVDLQRPHEIVDERL